MTITADWGLDCRTSWHGLRDAECASVNKTSAPMHRRRCVVCNCQKDYGSFWTGWLLITFITSVA